MEFQIESDNAVTSLFGYWPKFCDAKFQLLSFLKDASGSKSILMRLLYLDSDIEIGAEIELLFNGVSNIDINNLYDENVLDELVFSMSEVSASSKYIVSIESCCGISGVFNCEKITVKSVRNLTDAFS